MALDDENLPAALSRMLALAQERNLDLDFHADENDDPFSEALRHIADAVLRHEFPGRVLCGHCCSLAVQPAADVVETMARVKAAGLAVVSLPACNLYLQDRQPGRTPRWRGIPPLHELRAMGIPIAVGHDNCRDPFYPFGDHDLLAAWAIAVLVGHLTPSEWIGSITGTAADLLGVDGGGTPGPRRAGGFCGVCGPLLRRIAGPSPKRSPGVSQRGRGDRTPPQLSPIDGIGAASAGCWSWATTA
ncbi:MAG: amidohydrolase family protein [Oscillatoriales cyanobacterium SM2_1_8]|nr:amidohydrolase family protein [Oscillatoriales cyanobacterium SM2_1_8]